MITKISDRLVGKTVWFLDLHEGIKRARVVGLHRVRGRKGEDKWGLYHEERVKSGKIRTLTVWWPTTPLFETRQKLVHYIGRLLNVDKALDLTHGQGTQELIEEEEDD